MELQHGAIDVLDGARTPPSELRMWQWGPIRTLKGLFLFSKRSAKLIAEQWATLGREIGFDWEHDLWKKDLPGKDKESAGWGRVEVRADGLWITGIRWHPEAAAQIVQRAFRYLSQAFKSDPKTGEILSLENVALTNYPATLRPDPILLTARPPSPAQGAPMETLNDTQMAKDMGAAKMLAKRCAALAKHGQKCSEGSHPVLKGMGMALAAGMTEHMAALKAAFPEMGDDGGEDDEAMMERQRKEMSALLSFLEDLTGAKGDGLKPALMLLSQQAKDNVVAGQVGEEQQRLTLLDAMVKTVDQGGTQQIRPDQRPAFATWTLAELQRWREIAPRQGPKPPSEVIPVQLDGRPPDAAETKAAEQDALQLLGLDPASKWMQPGQGLSTAGAAPQRRS